MRPGARRMSGRPLSNGVASLRLRAGGVSDADTGILRGLKASKLKRRGKSNESKRYFEATRGTA